MTGAAYLHVRYNVGSSCSFLGILGYLGIEFLIDGQVHYGWMDLDNYNYFQTEIHGWAYESEPCKPILAGSIPEPSILLLACTTLVSYLFIRRRSSENINTRSEQGVAHQRAISSTITIQPPSQSRPWADI